MNNSPKKSVAWRELLKRGNFLPVKIAGAAIFIAVAVALSVSNFDYFWKAQEVSLFVPSHEFLVEKMQLAGGFLAYCGCFFVQFFYHPWVGCALLIAMSLLMAVLVAKAFRLPGRWWLLALIPSAMMFLSTVDIGYLIYSLKAPGYLYSNMLGLMFASAIFLCYRSIGNRWLKYAVLVVIAAALYPVMGFYALLTLVLCALYEVSLRTEGKKDWIAAVLAVLLAAVVPQLYWSFVYEQMTVFYIYLAGLPRFYMGARVLYEPFIVSFVVFAFFAVMAGRWKKDAGMTVIKAVALFAVFAFSIGGMWYRAFDDENFKVTMKMDRAMDGEDWETVVDCAAGLKGEPTRLMVEALEAGTVYMLPADKMLKLSRASWGINMFYRKMLEYSLIVSQVKADSWRFETAKERYLHLMKTQPEVIRRAPLAYIATYLLMTPETLSRVRAGAL